MREMKDSGVEWIGKVPSDYGTASIGSLFSIKKNIIGREPETVLSITQTGIRPKDLSSNEGQNASSYAHYQIVNEGDFAMNHMDLLTGWIDISKYEGVTSPDYRVFTLNDKEMSAEYFLRVFQYYYTNKVFFGFGQGVATLGRWRLPAINFKKIDVPVPPVLEQRRIIVAIDDSVGKVEALIANVQVQIEKLKAYKQSLITEVVTKGLDPTVPMKESGIVWVGEIPAEWKTIKMSRICDVITDYVASGSFASLAENVTYIDSPDYAMLVRTVDVSGKGHVSQPVYINQHAYEFLSNSNLYGGELMFPNIGASVGDVYIVPKLYEKMSLAPNSIMVRSGENHKYLYYYFCASAGRSQLLDIAQSTAQPKFNKTDFRQLRITLPSRKEQDEIVAVLDTKCDTVDRLIALKQSKIEKLEQYKRSLIYEYVTGKKEVS